VERAKDLCLLELVLQGVRNSDCFADKRMCKPTWLK